MAKRKQFGLSAALQQGLKDTILIAEDNTDALFDTFIPIESIEVDPENPRALHLSFSDLPNGPSEHDPLYQQKKEEFDSLMTLGDSIKQEGLINPIVVFKNGSNYRLVAGERRYLASVIIQKKNINARVFKSKPGPLSLRLLQWYENTAREDLNLKDRLDNIKTIIHEYKLKYQEDVTPTKLSEIICLSRPQATMYLAMLDPFKDVEQVIRDGKLNNLDKAVFLNSIQDPVKRSNAIQEILQGASVFSIKSKQKAMDKQSINLGSTKSMVVVKALVLSVLENPALVIHRDKFSENSWEDSRAATRAFKRLIKLLEQQPL